MNYIVGVRTISTANRASSINKIDFQVMSVIKPLKKTILISTSLTNDSPGINRSILLKYNGILLNFYP